MCLNNTPKLTLLCNHILIPDVEWLQTHGYMMQNGSVEIESLVHSDSPNPRVKKRASKEATIAWT